jgi:selenocysteine lyase/cysteine desulfurase
VKRCRRREHVRLGPGITTTPDEVDRLLDALAD